MRLRAGCSATLRQQGNGPETQARFEFPIDPFGCLCSRRRDRREARHDEHSAPRAHQLIVRRFWSVGAFFGRLSESTPSLYSAVAVASSTSPASENERLNAPV